METKLVVIGNSQGVRLPKSVIEQAGVRLEQPLRIEVRRGSIVLSPLGGVRGGWADAAAEAASSHEDLWSGLPVRQRSDDDWTW